MTQFKFSPMSDDEINRLQQEFENSRLLQPGSYDFVIATATEEVSKSGNNMIKLILSIWDKDGSQKVVFDYLIAIPSMAFKTKHFCESIDMLNQYEMGYINVLDIVGKCGKAELDIRKDKTGKYADKNVIKDYVKKIAQAKEDPFFDDDINILNN